MKKLLSIALAVTYISSALAVSATIQPEAATGMTTTSTAYGKHQMVVTNNPAASQAAQAILNQGGNAVDAAIAASFVLGLTEPQSSGIGGGGYALTYTAKSKKMFAYDGREVAPKSANPNWFLSESGVPADFMSAMLSPKSVGVPGEIALLYRLHKEQGKLAWAKLLQPAIDLADNGFPMSKRLNNLLIIDNEKGILNDPGIKAVYFNGDKIKPIGATVFNHDYTLTLKQIAQDPNYFYHSKLTDDIIDMINTKAKKQLYTKSDFTNYKVQRYNGICSSYKNKYQICSVPPSTSGGVAVLELLGIYSNNYNGTNINDINWIYNFSQASKLAFADRNQYLADPRFVKQPVIGLLDNSYIKQRSKLVTNHALNTPVSAGVPNGIDKKYAPQTINQEHGTTSLAVVDNMGNAITMTITVEHQFGSHIFTHGFFLNNQLTDFSLSPADKAGRLVANRVEAKKRPRSSIAPVIVFDNKKNVYLLTGAPGGSQIICYVAKNLIQVLDFKMNIADAVASPNLCAANGPLMLEETSALALQKPALEKMGEKVQVVPMPSGVASIIRNESGGWFGTADPRREGIALGD
ncbi:MAG: ggt [Burkholderiales bacterium]|jgi:gamma-glutamyltranspeptidase/glutathione hydrolase|nr:ggt [Burkholderiales bacterium]